VSNFLLLCLFLLACTELSSSFSYLDGVHYLLALPIIPPIKLSFSKVLAVLRSAYPLNEQIPNCEKRTKRK
jgi:hypothetical protein